MSGSEVAETAEDEFNGLTDDAFAEDQDDLQKALLNEGFLSVDQVQAITAAETALGQLDRTTLVTLAQAEVLDDVETYYIRVGETFESDDESYMEQEAVTSDQKGKVAEQERAARSKMAQRIVLFLLAVVVGESLVVGLALLKLKSNASGGNDVRLPSPKVGAVAAADDDNPLDLTPGAQAQALTALDIWRARKDAEFWQSLANYVVKSGSSLQSMMVAMGYIKNWISAASIAWGATEKSDAIKALVKAATSGHLSDMFTSVAAMQHGGQPLQRAVAADLCEHALAQMLQART
jgi:hypothetical protein